MSLLDDDVCELGFVPRGCTMDFHCEDTLDMGFFVGFDDGAMARVYLAWKRTCSGIAPWICGFM